MRGVVTSRRRATRLAGVGCAVVLVAACASGEPTVAAGPTTDASAPPAAASPTRPARSTAQPPAGAVATAPAVGTPSADVQDPTALGAPGVAAAGATAPTAPAASGRLPVSEGADAVLAGMTVEQKVGQLFGIVVFGDRATAVSDAAARANLAAYGVPTPAEVVERWQVGSVAYFAHDAGPGTSNVADVAAVAELSNGLQQAAASGNGVGLLIAADQEGGRVARIRAPATQFPPARAIGELGDADLAGRVAAATGRELRSLGVNWVFAPVADVNLDPGNEVIGDRAFGTSAAAVAPMVGAQVAGFARSEVLATVKHFPGHGDTTVDSHTSLPMIDHDLTTLRAVDLPPFAVSGSSAAVMVGHLAVPALDPSGTPATLSAPIIDGFLRAELGFDGLVVTDAMNMGALQGLGSPGDLARRALAAGVDVVLLPTDLPAAFAAVVAAVGDGSLPEAVVDMHVLRVLRAKEQVRVLDAASIPRADGAAVGVPEHRALRGELGARCAC